MATLLSNAEMLVPGEGQNIQGYLPATAYPIFKPMQISATDATTGEHTFVIANGRVDGFMTRASATTVGSPDAYLLWGFVSDTTAADASYAEGVYETPFEVSKMGSIAPGRIMEFEGSDYLGTSITTSTTVGTELKTAAGLFEAATAGDFVQFIVNGQLSANARETAGVRVQLMAVPGYTKAS